jgi:hypothetical protein
VNHVKIFALHVFTFFMQNLSFAYMKDKKEKNYAHINLELGISKELV